ncbi:MAG: hypothetical protein R3257_02945, partial [bacterium]|nr:hypothetical protein [bacterium]
DLNAAKLKVEGELAGARSQLEAARGELAQVKDQAERLETEKARLEYELAQKDTQVAEEVLVHNESFLKNITPKETTDFSSLNPNEVKSPVMYGALNLSPEGRVTGFRMKLADLKPNEGVHREVNEPTRPGVVPVVKVADTLLWVGSTRHLNGKQKTALKELGQNATQYKIRDPYTHQALVGEGMGPLAHDLFFVLPDAAQTIQQYGRANLQLVEADGRLRIYHEAANASWAFQAKKHLSQNHFKKLGTVTVEFSIQSDSQPGRYEIMDVSYQGEHFENMEGFKQILSYYGRSYAERVKFASEGKKETIIPGKPEEAPERVDEVEEMEDFELDRPTLPGEPRVPDLEASRPPEVRPAAGESAAPEKIIQVKRQKVEGGIDTLRPAEIRSGEADGEGVPTLHEKIHEFGELAGVTYEGVDYEKSHNEDGLGRFFTPEGSLVLVGVDVAGGHEGGKETTEAILGSLSRSIPGGKAVTEALELSGADILSSFLKSLGLESRADLPGYKAERSPLATVGVVKVNPPEREGDPYTLQPHWAGDYSIVVQRQVQGQWEPVWKSVPEHNAQSFLNRFGEETLRSYAKHNYPIEGTPNELVMKLGGAATTIENAVGIDGPINGVRTLREGQFGEIASVVKLSDGTEALELKPGDRVVYYSDGLDDNVGTTQQVINIPRQIEAGENSAEPYLRFVHDRQSALKQANEWIEAKVREIDEFALKNFRFSGSVFEYEGQEYEITQRWETGIKLKPADSQETDIRKALRAPIVLDGVERYADSEGVVYDHASGGNVVDHLKADNVSIGVFDFNPEILKTGTMPAVEKPERSPKSTPAQTPRSKRAQEEIEPEVDQDSPTSAFRNLSPGETLPLKPSSEVEAPAQGSLYAEGGKWRVKLIDGVESIEIYSEHFKADGSGETSTTTLTARKETFTLPPGKHVIRLGSQEYQIILQENGTHATFFAKDLLQATAHQDPIPLNSPRESETPINLGRDRIKSPPPPSSGFYKKGGSVQPPVSGPAVAPPPANGNGGLRPSPVPPGAKGPLPPPTPPPRKRAVSPTPPGTVRPSPPTPP